MPNKRTTHRVYEYVWLGPVGAHDIRSKTRVNKKGIWTFDGSSTGHAESTRVSEIVLRPVREYHNPFRGIKEKRNKSNIQYTILLCETYHDVACTIPTVYNHRCLIDDCSTQPWFSFEQEYFFYSDRFDDPVKSNRYPQHYYCRPGTRDAECEMLVNQHLRTCIEYGICISGINSEVAMYQWEFQIGPESPKAASDDLIIARYLLMAMANREGILINFECKPYPDINGSGCHINFSDRDIRSGQYDIEEIMNRFAQTHQDHMLVYGDGNQDRMTGSHETADYNNFTWGVGDRTASIRVPTLGGIIDMSNDRIPGYLEDRRPGANINPYEAVNRILTTLYAPLPVGTGPSLSG